MESDFWIKKWESGETKFNQSEYHPLLVKFANRFKSGTILVPLCGKTIDMHYLVSQGHHVIGVELSPIACKDFFVEAGIEFATKSVGEFTVYESKNVTLWCGDFFNLPKDVWAQITGLYDRAALIALPLELRAKYAEEIKNKIQSGVEILLITIEYDQTKRNGPPFSVVTNEVNSIYQSLSIDKVFSEVDENFSKDPRFSTEITEVAYWIKK